VKRRSKLTEVALQLIVSLRKREQGIEEEADSWLMGFCWQRKKRSDSLVRFGAFEDLE